jgi:(1->4)-alpha-D-glucan 1-alpha-D-glucosylmutase
MVESADKNRLPATDSTPGGATPQSGPPPTPPSPSLRPPDTSAHADLAAEDLFEAATQKLCAPRLPVATYRVQLNHEFTFQDAAAQVDYLAELGASDLYASPFFRARPGSMHGYDLVEHGVISPSIGAREDFNRLTDDLSERGMGLLLDFVPNHMGIGSDNPWWMDVLENGPSSLFASFFDIDWAPLKSELRNKVLLPILGDHYGRVLENGELRLEIEQGAFFLRYYETTLPVNPRTYPMVLEPMLPELIAKLGEEHDAVLELQSILTGLSHLPPRTETQRAKVIERRREKEVLKRRLAAALDGKGVGDGAGSTELAEALVARLAVMNGKKGDAKSFDALAQLLEEQAYRLSFWRVAAEEINYRRFFDVNELAAIRMELQAVFDQAHRLVLSLVGEGRVTGLRIDHPDGLWNPHGYFCAVQRAVFLERCRRFAARGGGAQAEDRGPAPPLRADVEAALLSLFGRAFEADPRAPSAKPLYMVVEKILSRGETLPESFPVHGTSGYEFTNLVGGLFVDPESERAMTETYERFIGQRTDFESLVYEKKKQVLLSAMASELNVLAHALNRLSERDRNSRDFTLGTLTDALREVIACFPIYRTYVTESTQTLSEHDRIAVTRAVRLALRRNPMTDPSVYAFLRSILMLEVPQSVLEEHRPLWREFVMKFQQLTGPVMAKGLEDTAFYNYNRLISLNEVGGEPERYGTQVAAFHRANAERQRLWPSSLLATSTHDTKRSEDVRARISVIAEMPRAWEAAVTGLSDAAARYKTDLEGQRAPDRNEEYMLYQTLVGSMPSKRESEGPRAWSGYVDRIVAYMRKATKEAKVNTSWINARPEYDAAVEAFVRGLLSDEGPLEEHLGAIARAAAYHGRWGSLSQTLLKLMSPGVPDIYQGTEMWDDSLVDPDNRRPVDYAVRLAALLDLRARMGAGSSSSTGTGTGTGVSQEEGEGRALARELVESAEDGRIKLFVTHVALRTRHRLPELFGASGTYAPLDATGRAAAHVVAFARRSGDREVVVIAPRLSAKLMEGRLEPPVGAGLRDTWLPVAEGRFRCLFTGADEATEERDGVSYLPLDRVLADFPVALLERTARAE